MDEEQYAALLAKLAELEARIEALSHHGMDHGSSDPLDNGIYLKEVSILPPARKSAATIYLQNNGGFSRLMIQYQKGVPVQISPAVFPIAGEG